MWANFQKEWKPLNLIKSKCESKFNIYESLAKNLELTSKLFEAKLQFQIYEYFSNLIVDDMLVLKNFNFYEILILLISDYDGPVNHYNSNHLWAKHWAAQ